MNEGGRRAIRLPRSPNAQRLAWAVLAVCLVLGSAIAARQWQTYVGNQQDRMVQTTTANATASLSLALQRDEDLVETLRGVVGSGTTVTNARFVALYANLGATKDSGLIGLAYIESVPSTDLSGFEAQLAADPPFGQRASPPSPLGSVGARPRYCLIRLAAAGTGRAVDLSPAVTGELAGQFSGGRDYCSGRYAAALARSAATGHQSVSSFARASVPAARAATPTSNTPFNLFVPVYRADLPLATRAQREQALLGWADGLFSPSPVLSPVVNTSSGLSVRLTSQNPAGAITVAAAGRSLPGAFDRTVRLAADGNWVASISVVPSDFTATLQGFGVLGSIFIMLLLAALTLSLSRSRRSALRSIKRQNQELEHRSLHDTLTGLPNRDLVLDRSAAMLAQADQSGQPVAALLIGLDGFNGVNATYGHLIGDEVMVAVAERLASSLGPSDTLGRIGGDEFVVLAEGPSIAAGAGDFAGRLLTVLSAPYQVSMPGADVRITACIGVALGAGRSAEDLLRDADTALNEAKSAGKHRVTEFEPEMHTAARSKLSLQVELRTAIEQGQFFVLYQPIFDLPGLVPIGVEALLRWRHPRRGVVQPLDFIPLLEETGMITVVGREVLRRACQQTQEWGRRGLPIFVTVNASAIQLESEQFCLDVAEVLEQTGLDPGRLTIEITESALMRDAHDAVGRLSNLKALGIRLAIDDFGTGYSSLSYLRRFPVDILKVDRAFVSAMTTSTGGMALVRTMLELARALDLGAVAEGIEEEAQLTALERLHCRSGQGFLLAKPLEAEQIELFFDNARPRKIGVAVGPT